MDIKKPTEAELTAWLKDNGFDHDTHVYVPASKVADMPDLPATSIGDLLDAWLKKVETLDDYNLIPKEYVNKVETPADYVFDPKTPIKPRREPTVHNIDLTKKTPADYWRKLALDFRADRDRLQKQVDESGASYRRTIADMKRAINEKTDLIARLRGCLDKERDAYAKLHKEVDKYIEAIKENNAAHHETH